LVVESWKDAPTIQELYEQTLSSKNLTLYINIKGALKETETNLNLNKLFIENLTMSKHFDTVFDSIKASAKQQSLNNNFVKNLIHIDLSSNMINDDIFINFIESVLNECQNLKILNLALNLITLKGIKALNDMAHSIKTSGKTVLFVNLKKFLLMQIILTKKLLASRKFGLKW
jgi:hypothetical protein